MKILVFFPYNPWPQQSGGQKRCLDMLSGLKDWGAEITFLSCTLHTTVEWSQESVQYLKKNFVKDLHVYHPRAIFDRYFIDNVYKFYHFFKRRIPLNSMFYTPPRMRLWFAKIFQKVKPDMVLMNYVRWDGLINYRIRKSTHCVVESHDLLSLNMQMWADLKKHLPHPPVRAKNIDERFLKEDYISNSGLTPFAKEFRIYDKYRHTIAISKEEADIIKRNTKKTKTLLIPFTHEAVSLDNNYSAPPVFPTGPNPFNIQAYLYFVAKVLPRVLKEIPSFILHVSGYVCEQVACEDGIEFKGFVPDLKDLYRSASFLICPVITSTGQQAKIVEAMAFGLPVIALRRVGENSPIEHQVSGFIADGADEFAHYTIRLWRDKALCRRMGEAARDTISTKFSRAHMTGELAALFDQQ